MSSGFIINLLTLLSIYSLLSVSLNLILGFSGLIHLGHIAIYGIGAYTSVLLSTQGFPILPAILIGGLVATIFSYALMFSTRKLKGDYLALATLSFAFVVHSLLLNLGWLTSGPMGIIGIDRPSGFDNNLSYLILTLSVAVIGIKVIHQIVKSPFGVLLQAVRDDEILLRTQGKNTFKLKIKAMCLGSFFSGICGGLFAHYIGYIHPDFFNLDEVIILLTIVIIGGLASIKGSIIATLIFISLPELIRLIGLPHSLLGPVRQIIYASILIAILMFRTRGMFGKVDLD